MFEAIEEKKRTKASEVVEIKSDLTLEHIMPQKWREHWAIPSTPGHDGDEIDIEQTAAEMDRDGKIHLMGNLTLLTQALNASVSNGPFSTKMPAVRAQSALILNRDLHGFEEWNEKSIIARGLNLFEAARSIWPGPMEPAPSEDAAARDELVA